MKIKEILTEKRKRKRSSSKKSAGYYPYYGYFYGDGSSSGDSGGDGGGGESMREGGWDSTVTQGTIIRPQVVGVALKVVQQFVQDFNAFLAKKGHAPVEMGRPTGSSAYHEQDQEENPDKIYGDIDLQMIAVPEPDQTYGQFTAFWNQLSSEFISTQRPSYVHAEESKPGHPIIEIGKDSYVQVDFMWHEEKLRDWGAARVTPEHGVKGLLTGNMFSVFGELLDMSVQHAGVQLKVQNGERVPFSKQKDTQVVTVTINPNTFILDVFKYLAVQQEIESPKVHSALKQNSGINMDAVKIADLVTGIKGFAASVELNDMFGRGDLKNFSGAQDFIAGFWQRYQEKAMIDVQGKKRDKAQTPDAIARAESDRQKILQGLEQVKRYFA